MSKYTDLPIDEDILRKKIQIPKLLAELSYKDEREAVRLLRDWGERKRTISQMYEDLNEALKEREEVV